MSALIGIAFFDGQPASTDRIQPGMDWLAFYGPDNSGAEVLDSAAFGHHLLRLRRDAAVEVSPLRVEDRWLVTSNARLDNRAELCSQLSLDSDAPDALMMLHAYQKWGRDFPAHLLGDYVFAIWDQHERSLLLGRDHIGTRALYYYVRDGVAAFASEMEPLLILPDVGDEIDDAEVNRFMLAKTVAYHSNYHTFYKDVHKVPFGTTVLITPDGPSIQRCWFPEQVDPLPEGDGQEYAEEMLRLIEEAVRCRIDTDYAVGSHLSGGLDSSSVAVIAGRQLAEQGRSIIGYSWSPPPEVVGETTDTEVGRVHMIAEHEGITMRYVDPVELLRGGFKPPDVTLRAVHTLKYERPVGRTAHEDGIRLMLSGWGGDEFATFNGRGHRIDQFKQRQFLALAHNLKGPEAPWISFAGIKNIAANFKSEIYDALRADEEAIYNPPPPFLNGDVDHKEDLIFDRPPTMGHSARETQLNLYYSGHVAYRMEAWAWSGAEHQIRYVYPLTDRRVMAFAFALPGSMYTQKGWNRYLFRLASAPIFPEGMTWNRYGPIKEDTTLRPGMGRDIQRRAMEQLKSERAAQQEDEPDEEQAEPISEEERQANQQALQNNPFINIDTLRTYPRPERRRNAALIRRTRQVLMAYLAWTKRHDVLNDQ